MVVVEARKHIQQLKGLDGNRKGLTMEVLQGAGRRTRATWPDASGLAGSSTPHSLRPPLSDGTGVLGHVDLDQRRLEGAAPPGLLATGRSRVDSRHWPPALPPPTPSQQHRPQWPSIDLVQLVRLTAAGNTDTATTPVATTPHFGGASQGPAMNFPSSSSSSSALDGEAAVPQNVVDGGSMVGWARGSAPAKNHPHHRRAFRSQPQWSSYAGAESSLSAQTPGADGLRPRDHGSPLGSVDGTQGRSSGAKLSMELGSRGAQPAGGLLQWTEATPYHPYPSTSSPTQAKRAKRPNSGVDVAAGVDEFPAPKSVAVSRGYQLGKPSRAAAAAQSPASASGGEQHQDTNTLPSILARLQGEGTSGAMLLSPPVQEIWSSGIDAHLPPLSARDSRWQSHSAGSSSGGTEAASATTSSVSLPPPWDFGRRGRGGEGARPSKQGGGLASLGLGETRWQGDGARRGDAGDWTEPAFDRSYRGDRVLRGPPTGGETHPHASLPRDRRPEDSCFQLGPMSSSADTTAAAKPPRFGRCDGDPASYGTASRPLFSGVVHPAVHSSHPWPELVVEATATTVGDQAPGARTSFSIAGLHGDSARRGGGGGGVDTVRAAGAATVAEWEQGQQSRLSEPRPTQPSKAKGCMEAGCDRQPRYGYKGSKTPAYCATHRAVGMVDTRHPFCKDRKCTRQPSFGMEGDRRASFCASHKTEKMVNVTSRRCRQLGCLYHPNFGFPGDRRASYCKEHRETGMVDVVSRRCQDPSCTRRPLYNVKGLRPEFCSQHRLSGMIDVVSARCREPGCMSHPSFGYASDKKARRCARHRLKDMESVKGRRQKRPREEHNAEAATAATITASTTSHPAQFFPTSS